jgi:NAD(P)-dependent dehydrogenase (short-subunit alcohol dehydrogenase family)
MTSRLCEDRVVVISGAGRGIGRAHAVALAEAGAKIVINDIGASLNGVALAEDPASTLAAEISHAGGHAVANHDDVSTEEGARNLIDQAISEFGTLDVVINNAGIIRDSMIFNMTASDFDAVLKVHLRSTFLTSHRRSGATVPRPANPSTPESSTRPLSLVSTAMLARPTTDQPKRQSLPSRSLRLRNWIVTASR